MAENGPGGNQNAGEQVAFFMPEGHTAVFTTNPERVQKRKGTMIIGPSQTGEASPVAVTESISEEGVPVQTVTFNASIVFGGNREPGIIKTVISKALGVFQRG